MIHGFINFFKPPGMTSHDAVSFIRHTYGLKRVGHAGTLDPAAAGVLPIAVGGATRLIEYMTDAVKEYRTELSFGYETDSGDVAGQVTGRSSGDLPDSAVVNECLQSFVGSIWQTPPIYSAIKINGKKLYELARAGVEATPPPRRVTIEAIRLITAGPQQILFDVTCSKGTYIRSLGRDIAHGLGLCGTVTFLLRKRVGHFCSEDAVTAEEIRQNPAACLLPMEQAVASLPRYEVNEAEADHFIHGRSFAASLVTGTIYAVFQDQGILLGIGRQSDSGYLLPQKVLGVGENSL